MTPRERMIAAGAIRPRERERAWGEPSPRRAPITGAVLGLDDAGKLAAARHERQWRAVGGEISLVEGVDERGVLR